MDDANKAKLRRVLVRGAVSVGRALLDEFSDEPAVRKLKGAAADMGVDLDGLGRQAEPEERAGEGRGRRPRSRRRK